MSASDESLVAESELAALEQKSLEEQARTRRDCADLIHKIEVQRLQLEMQNQQLCQSELQLAATRDRYFDLFDLAPVAYLTVNHNGVILEANHAAATLFGNEQAELLGSNLGDFVVPEHTAAFRSFRKDLYSSGESQACELSCKLGQDSLVPVRMQGVAPAGRRGKQDASITIIDLSEVVRAQTTLAEQEVELRRTEDRLASFMRATNDCVFVLSPDGIIKAVNPATLALLGFEEEKVLGNHVGSLDYGTTPSIGPGVRSAEMTWVDKYGRLHTLLLSISPIRDIDDGTTTEFLCVAQDISERKAAEEKLKLSENLLRQMAETIEDGFYVREFPSGELSYVSPAYEDIFGCSREEFYAQPGRLMGFVHPEDKEELTRAYDCFVKGDPCDEQFRIIRLDGEVRWIRERAFLVEEDGRGVERIVGIIQDITDQVQLELELRQGQKMEAIGQLASGVAHDFNNILMGVHGCASIALSKLDESNEVRPFLEAIRKSSESGTAIIKQLLVFSTKRELEVHSFNLNALVVSVETMLTRLLGDDVVLRIAPSESECWVRMDSGQVEQILMNLAINARDAMPEGGQLIIETELVHGAESRESDRTRSFVELRVRDTGVGMSEEVRQRIFEPFFTTKGIGEGTGLGLSTVYGIVQEAGGSTRCISEPGQGTTFVVRLPLVEADTTREDPLADRADSRPGRESEGATLLIVEDEDTVRLATRLYLESDGYEVLEAANGAEAVEILNECSWPIDLLLTDVGLPGFSGAGLAARARELKPDIPVLFMSAHPEDWLIHHGRLSKGEATLQKPFSKSELIAKVRGMLFDAVALRHG